MAIAVDTFRTDDATRSLAETERSGRRVERSLLAALGVQIAFLLPSLVAYAMDERLLEGVSIWSKPVKFETSIIVFVATLLLLLPLIRPEVLARRLARFTSVAVALAATLEIIYIIIQAARGRASHFNISTPLEATFYQLMGVGAVTLVICSFIFGWLIFRHGRADTGQGLRLGAASGLMLGSVLTLITAGILSSGAFDGPGHWVGGIKTDAGGLFLLGWSRTGGDLRVPHFFATHMMQALPLLGLALDRLRPDSARRGVLIVAGIATVVATFVQAASGRPFL
jgi:hypothetical protein